MQKVTRTNDHDSTEDFFPQSYTDAALAAAAIPPMAVDLILTDGSTRKFVPAA